MKPRTIAWLVLLLATHVAAFLIARGMRGDGAAGGAAAKAAELTAREQSNSSKSAGRGRESTSHARLLQKLLEMDLSREEFVRARARLLNDWAKHDLRAVLDLVYGPNSSSAIWLHGRVLMDEIQRQPDEVLEWILSGRFGSKRQIVEKLWFDAMKDAGRYDKIFAMLPQATEERRKDIMRDLAQTPGPRQEEALKSIREALATWYQKGDERIDVIFSYTHSMARLHAGDPHKLFEGETDPEIREKLAQDWSRNRFGYPPTAERLGEIRELPESARAAAINQMMIYFKDQRIAGIKRPLEELNRQEMWSELAAEGTKKAILLSASAEKEKGGTQTFETVMAISDPATRALLMQSVGGGSVPKDSGVEIYDQAAELLDPGPELDGYLAGMVRSMAYHNMDLAFQGLSRIGNAELQAQMLKELEAKKAAGTR